MLFQSLLCFYRSKHISRHFQIPEYYYLTKVSRSHQLLCGFFFLCIHTHWPVRNHNSILQIAEQIKIRNRLTKFFAKFTIYRVSFATGEVGVGVEVKMNILHHLRCSLIIQNVYRNLQGIKFTVSWPHVFHSMAHCLPLLICIGILL